MPWWGILRLVAVLAYASAVVGYLEPEILPHVASGALAAGLLLLGAPRLAGPAIAVRDGQVAGRLLPTPGLSRLTGALICASAIALGVLGIWFFKSASALVYVIAGTLWSVVMLVGLLRMYRATSVPQSGEPRAGLRQALLLILPGVPSIAAGLLLTVTGVVFYGEYAWRCSQGCGWQGMFSILTASVMALNGTLLVIFGDWRLHWRGFRRDR